MVKKLLFAAWFAVMAQISVGAAVAATPDDAKAMAEKAVLYLQENGPEKTFAAIDDPTGPFRKGDLYVFVHDASGLVMAHGGNPNLIGKNTVDLTDIDGKAFVKEFIGVKDTAWVDYKWQNPVTKTLEAKTAYIIHTGKFFVGAGAYRK